MNEKKDSKHSLKGVKVALGIFSTLTVVFLVTTIVLGFIVLNGNITTIKTSAARSTILALVDQQFIGDKPDQKLQDEGELKGLVSALNDPYSQYLSQDETKEFRDSINEEYEGIGVRFADKEGVFVITQVMDNGPAKKAGVQEGDILSEINDENIANSTLEEVTSKIKGPQGTSVDLKFFRGEEVVSFSIQREAIKTDLVTFDVEGEYAVIKISSFGDGVSNRLESIAADVKANQKIKGIILDLRSNTGGILSEGIGATSFFVDQGDVITYEVGNTDQRTDTATTVKNSLKDYPIAILVDQYTASASEIMTAGIRDNRGDSTVVIGKTTFGKGVVQKLFPLPDGGTLKLTVAEWLTPNKDKINKKGITPTIEIDPEAAPDKAKEKLSTMIK